jgi:hypothetical protein
MHDNGRWANAKMNAVQSPPGISQCEEQRGTRTLLLRACSLLGLALVISLAVLFLDGVSPQDSQLSTQAMRSAMSRGTQ